MAAVKEIEGRKWINTAVALSALLIVRVIFSFASQMGEWFDLESKIGHFILWSYFVAGLAGFVTFLSIITNKKSILYLGEVYGELVKVIWPAKDSVIKLTIGIIISLIITSIILFGIDYLCRSLLSFFY